MASLGRGKNVIIVIGADDQSGNILEKVKLGLKGVESSGKSASSGMRDMRSAWFAATAAATGLVAAVGKVMALYAEQERVERRLQSVLRAKGIEVQATSQHLFEYASALQRASIYGDEAIIPVQQLLIQLGELGGETLDRATKLTLDFASAMGLDLQSAATLMAKAASGNTSALSRYGIQVDKNIPATEKFAAVLDQVEQKFGGTAQSDVNTFSGQIAQLKNSFGDLTEQIGAMNSGVLTTAVSKWNEWATAAVDAIARVNAAAGKQTEADLIQATINNLEAKLEQTQQVWSPFGKQALGEDLSEERVLEIMDKITRLKQRLKFLNESPDSPLAPGSPSAPGAAPPEAGGGGTETWRPMELPEADADTDAQELNLSATALEARRNLEESYRQEELARKIAHAAELANIDTDAQEISLESLRYFEEEKSRIAREQNAARIEAARMGFEAIATAFPQFKAAAIAEATIRGGVAFMNALSVQPWYVGLSQAALAAAKTKSAIDNIKRTGIRTGGGTSSYSYGGATQTVSAQAAPTPTNVTINVSGGTRVLTPQEQGQIAIDALEAHLKETGNRIGDIELNVVTGG